MFLRSSFLGLLLTATVFGLAASSCSDDGDPAGVGGGASASSSSSSGSVGSTSSGGGSGGAGGGDAKAICDAAQAFVDMCQMGSGGAGGNGGASATGGAGGGVLSFPDCSEVELCEAHCVLNANTCQDLLFDDNITDCIFCCHSPCN